MSKFKDVKSVLGRTLTEANGLKEKPVVEARKVKVERPAKKRNKSEEKLICQEQTQQKKPAVPRAADQLKLVMSSITTQAERASKNYLQSNMKKVLETHPKPPEATPTKENTNFGKVPQ
eukprot:TRINITY_DN12303_c0_g2_i1.p1 TRINITY_DN12303_c0_g2~~TRINITY_DN12303_c0_g2_i1.p1  ORF type:complete len:119 (+),score=25.77 TRINITY_DN12303_c0_g2_i1:308-664(+)